MGADEAVRGVADPPLVCAVCRHAFEQATGELVKGQEHVQWVVPDEEVCRGCRERIEGVAG